jgi:hypothetical protein
MHTQSQYFSEPLGLATSGHLVFASGADGVTLRADRELPDLYRAHFEDHVPSVRVEGGRVTIQYGRLPFFDWLAHTREPLADVTLNGSIPWEIEFHGGVSRLDADLSELALRALDLSSSSQVALTLPQPSGAVFVNVSGSVSDMTIHLPHGVPVRVRIDGGVSRLALDEQRWGAVGRGIHWQTPDYDSAADRYDVSMVGSASNLTIGVR